MKKKQNKTILRLQTYDWNSLTTKEQDKALIFMYRVLGDLSQARKNGIGNEFFAQYP